MPIALAVVLTVFLTPQPRFDGTVGTDYLTAIEETSYPCPFQRIPDSGSRCFQSKQGEPIDFVVLGDSHAEHLYLGVRSTFYSLNTAYVYLPNWPYVPLEDSAALMQEISELPDLKAVLLNSKWDAGSAATDQLASTVGLLSEAATKVFVADDGPTFSFHAEECQYDRILGPEARCSESSEGFDRRHNEYSPILEDQISASPNAYLLRTADGICQDGLCSMTQGDALLYADHGHLNELGSRRVIERLANQDRLFGSIK